MLLHFELFNKYSLLFFCVLGVLVSKNIKEKKIYYMLLSLSALKLFKAKIGMNEEICSVLICLSVCSVFCFLQF